MLLAKNKLVSFPLPREAEEDLRAQRTWHLLDVMFLAWAFFCVFFWLRGYQAAAAIAQTQTLCYLVIQVAMRKKQHCACFSFRLLFWLHPTCLGSGNQHTGYWRR